MAKPHCWPSPLIPPPCTKSWEEVSETGPQEAALPHDARLDVLLARDTTALLLPPVLQAQPGGEQSKTCREARREEAHSQGAEQVLHLEQPCGVHEKGSLLGLSLAGYLGKTVTALKDHAGTDDITQGPLPQHKSHLGVLECRHHMETSKVEKEGQKGEVAKEHE